MRPHSQHRATFTNAHEVRFGAVASHARRVRTDTTAVKRTNVWGVDYGTELWHYWGDYGTPATHLHRGA